MIVFIPENKKRNDDNCHDFGIKKVICEFKNFRNDGFSGIMASVGVFRMALRGWFL